MVVLSFVLGPLVLLALACLWEARTGRRRWDGPGSRSIPPTTRDAARSAQVGIASTLALGGFLGGFGDG